MLDFLKKVMSKNADLESMIFCPHCNHGFRGASQNTFFEIKEYKEISIYKCKKCNGLFVVSKKTYLEPSLYISYTSYKIEEKNTSVEDCIGQFFFDFYYPS